MLRFPLCRFLIVALLFSMPAVSIIAPERAFASPKSGQDVKTYVVTRVVDGDTIVLSNGLKVRLTGIDTPESSVNDKTVRDSRRTGEDMYAIIQKGKEAARFVKTMIQGKKVRLEYDVQKQDRYGRELAYVYDVETLKTHPEFKNQTGLSTSGEEIFLNGSIVRSGYAMPLTVPPNVKYAGLFRKLYQEARENKRGLWAAK